MVNKGIVVIGVIVVLSATGVGVLIGMQMGGDATSVPPADGDSGSDGTSDGGSTDGGSDEATATATATPVATTEARPDLPPSEFNANNISRHIEQYINEERSAAGLAPLDTEGTTPQELDTMAESHADSMADVRRVLHEIEGSTTADRYRAAGLYETCKFRSARGDYIVYPDSPEESQFEAIARTTAGSVFEEDGEEQYYTTDGEVARAIVDEWFASSVYSDRLLLQNLDRMGVGVKITDSGDVYATANVCG